MMEQKDFCSKYFIEETSKRIFSIPNRPINETDQETLDFLKTTKKTETQNYFCYPKKLKLDNDIKGVFIPLTVPASIKTEFDLNNNLLDFCENEENNKYDNKDDDDDKRKMCHRWFEIGYCNEVYLELDFFTFVMLQCQSEREIDKHVTKQTIYEYNGPLIASDITYSYDYFDELETKNYIGDEILEMCGHKDSYYSSYPKQPICEDYFAIVGKNTELSGMLLEDLHSVLNSEKKIVQDLVYNSSLKSGYNPNNTQGSQEIEKLISCVLNGKTCNSVWEFLTIYFDKCLGTKFYNENFSDASFYNIITNEATSATASSTSQKDFCSKGLSTSQKDFCSNGVSTSLDVNEEDAAEGEEEAEIKGTNEKDDEKDSDNSNKDNYRPYEDKNGEFKFLKNVAKRFDDTLELENIEFLLQMSFEYFGKAARLEWV